MNTALKTKTAPGDPDYVDPAVWVTTFTIIVGAMAVVFDATIVSVAIRVLTTQLHASLSTIQWVSTGYVFRVVQGIGGGVMLPLMTTLIMQATGGRNIGRVMATIMSSGISQPAWT